MIIRNNGSPIDITEFIENGNGPQDLLSALDIAEDRMAEGAVYLQVLDPIFDKKTPEEWSRAEFLLGPFDFIAIRPNGELTFETSSLISSKKQEALYDVMENFSKKGNTYNFIGMKFETVYVVIA